MLIFEELEFSSSRIISKRRVRIRNSQRILFSLYNANYITDRYWLLCSPLGVPLSSLVTQEQFSTNEKQGLGTCPSLSCQNKVLFIWKASFQKTPNCLARKESSPRKMPFSCLERIDLFRATMCYGRLRVCLVWQKLCWVYWHLIKHVYYTGFGIG